MEWRFCPVGKCLAPVNVQRKRIRPLQEGTQAEVLVVAAFVELAEYQSEHDWPRALAFLKSLWQPPEKSVLRWEREQVERLRADLREYSKTWKTMKPGEEISLNWPH